MPENILVVNTLFGFTNFKTLSCKKSFLSNVIKILHFDFLKSAKIAANVHYFVKYYVHYGAAVGVVNGGKLKSFTSVIVTIYPEAFFIKISMTLLTQKTRLRQV